jgi:hypothetical protein
MSARMLRKRNVHTLLVECKLGKPLWKTIWRLLKKLNIDLPYDPAIPFLGIYPKECDSSYYKDTCTPMFIAALCTTAKLWKQPRCPTTNEWIKKMVFNSWGYTQKNVTQVTPEVPAHPCL